MILLAPVLALQLATLLSSLAMLASGLFAIQLLWSWDRDSGSRRQLALERRTSLVSTAVVLVMLVETLSLFVYVFTMDKLATHVVGAMCAVGSMNASDSGFPILFLGLGIFLGASIWLVLDWVDNQSPLLPLIRVKYLLLLFLAPLVLTRTGMLWQHFRYFDANVAVSCCSTTFTPTSTGVMADISGLAPGQALAYYYGVLVVLLLLGSLLATRPGLLFSYSVWSLVYFLTTIMAVISVFSLYVYEHPNHHCPFCFLKFEYAYLGYLLYAPLLMGTALGLAAGVLQLIRKFPDMEALAPRISGVLARTSLWLLTSTGILLSVAWWRSRLVLFGT